MVVLPLPSNKHGLRAYSGPDTEPGETQNGDESLSSGRRLSSGRHARGRTKQLPQEVSKCTEEARTDHTWEIERDVSEQQVFLFQSLKKNAGRLADSFGSACNS